MIKPQRRDLVRMMALSMLKLSLGNVQMPHWRISMGSPSTRASEKCGSHGICLEASNANHCLRHASR